MVNQCGAFNSPVWFNCGLWAQYGITGSGGNWAAAVPGLNAHGHTAHTNGAKAKGPTQVFETKNRWTFLIDGTARAGIEAALVSLLEPGDKVVVPSFGRFGLRKTPDNLATYPCPPLSSRTMLPTNALASPNSIRVLSR